MLRLQVGGLLIDPLTLKQRIAEDREMDAVGGITYFGEGPFEWTERFEVIATNRTNGTLISEDAAVQDISSDWKCEGSAGGFNELDRGFSMTELPVALQAWSAWPQFILWTREMRNGKLAKVPIDHRTLQPGSVTNPAIYMSAQEAFYKASLYGDAYGVGFCFTEKDPFFFIDIDAGLQGGQWSALTHEITTQFKGAAQEVSQSEIGLHVFGTYKTFVAHSNKNIQENIELYTTDRFVALTGNQMSGSVDSDHTIALTNLTAKYFPPTSITTPQEWTDKPVKHWDGIEDDAELIKQACKSSGGARAAFGYGTTFKDLWEANADALGKAYPDLHSGRAYDASSADMALACRLAFWTGNNCERILRLMQQSALRRSKWDDRLEDYLKVTIIGACSLQTGWYNKNYNKSDVPQMMPGEIGDPEAMRSGWQVSTPPMQVNLFKNFCYVQDKHGILDARGVFHNPQQFNATYGGYSFQIDDSGKKYTTKAFDAFTQSQVTNLPQADFGSFRPDKKPGEIFPEEGRMIVNTYFPIKTPRMKGDPEPFLAHLRKVLPDERDQEILLSYMAACIQKQGTKFRWAPLLQGTEGNGKTLFTLCVCHAIGSRYYHLPPANEIAEKFNPWLFEKFFIGVEEMHLPEHKREIIEVLKPMISNDNLAMRAMNQSQVMRRNYANFMLNSNKRDAVPKSRNDRRFCVFFTAQQSVDDLVRDGMKDTNYFKNLYGWLNAGGYAIVADYLWTYSIPDELNPATSCTFAPVTSTTHEAIDASLGPVEQEIKDAVDEGRLGFAGGWISSYDLGKLLESLHLRRAISPSKRCEILESLGYVRHPGLKDGRVTRRIPRENNGKPRLYIKKDHEFLNLRDPAEIVRQYLIAQEEAVSLEASIAPFPMEVPEGPQK